MKYFNSNKVQIPLIVGNKTYYLPPNTKITIEEDITNLPQGVKKLEVKKTNKNSNNTAKGGK